ncbi:MAG: RNA-binding domain-containing protein [Bacteroidales bacterium]
MDIHKIINQSEGRRLEFKESMPKSSDLSKTVIAFANDAGGDIYIGIKDSPRKIVGVPEEELVKLEEQISNFIHDKCYPGILPDISFINVDDKALIKISIYRGSTPPYYLKEKGKHKGTYIRVGSSNRLADESILAELERRKQNVSFDNEVVIEKSVDDLDISTFSETFIEKTHEKLDREALQKLDLIKELNKTFYPTRALILLSDDELRNSLFHFAKVECARFKGVSSEEFIDQKSILTNISIQAEEAYNFVLRHINKGASVKGVYTVSRWEYPVNAIREVIRNAIVHRDYSLTGKDVKVAVYDNIVEITSPGLLPPSIDYGSMISRQSDARNKTIAPVFKHLGIIDQWGNGLKLIAKELEDYPDIEFKWQEVGLSFQVQFIKSNHKIQQELGQELGQDLGQELGQDLGQDLGQELGQERKDKTLFSLILIKLQSSPLSRAELAKALDLKKVSGHLNRTISKLHSHKLLEHTIPEKPNHPKQRFRITERGALFLHLLEDDNTKNQHAK